MLPLVTYCCVHDATACLGVALVAAVLQLSRICGAALCVRLPGYWCLCSSPPGLSEDDLIVNVDVVRIVVVVVVVVRESAVLRIA